VNDHEIQNDSDLLEQVSYSRVTPVMESSSSAMLERLLTISFIDDFLCQSNMFEKATQEQVLLANEDVMLQELGAS
jgi:hypothetical protein